MPNILVIDPSRSMRNTLKERLEYEGYYVEATDDPTICEHGIESKFDLVIYGHNEGYPIIPIPWIKISNNNNAENALESMKQGAADFIVKPIDMNRLMESVKRCMEMRPERDEESGNNVAVNSKSKNVNIEEMIGDSIQMQRLRRVINKVAVTESRVLITGANGTGKELVARQVHERSRRADYPFISVNCAAIPSELIESELFGHEKGAFTSAIKQRKGKFELANGGTLFLDEIGDMSLSAQTKILRVLQEKKMVRIGGEKVIDLNVRVLAATNKDLESEMERGNFREDLYHRLSVITIHVPTLAERIDDIPALVEFFARRVCDEYDLPPKTFDKDALRELKRMSWHGNIRQLSNIVERLIVLSDNDIITIAEIKAYAPSVIVDVVNA